MTRPATTIAIAAILGLLAVIAGAAGTHALRNTLDAGALRTFETAARFQMYHALALLAAGLLFERWQTRALTIAAALFTLGTVLFSGSLYILALTSASSAQSPPSAASASWQAGQPSPSPPSARSSHSVNSSMSAVRLI